MDGSLFLLYSLFCVEARGRLRNWKKASNKECIVGWMVRFKREGDANIGAL